MQVAKQENSKIIILLNSNTGKTIGPRLSIKLNASYISNVIDTPIEKDNLIVKKVYRENILLAHHDTNDISHDSKTLTFNLNSSSDNALNI